MRMHARRIIAIYLTFQAISLTAWWAFLLAFPTCIDWFKPAHWPGETLHGFLLADVLLLVGGSVGTAIAVLRNWSWAVTAIWSLAAVSWYPTLYCIGVSVLTGEAWISSAMMASMAGLTLAMATIQGNANQVPATIRTVNMNKTVAVVWTFAQTTVFWCVFLWVLPMGLVELQGRLGLSVFTHSRPIVLPWVLFVIASMLGLWTGVVIAIHGTGTPLPTATASKLVLVGPYRVVRNPMALTGIMQGVAVGWILGSYLVIAYALAGALAWHWFVRPVEQHDLEVRFGHEYRVYKSKVSLWVPTFQLRR